MVIIFGGTIACSGTGGQAWVSMQYLIGLRELGHEVFYLEDAGESSWIYDFTRSDYTESLDFPASYLKQCLEPIDFAGRWIYRAGEQSVGMPLPAFRDVCAGADLLILQAAPIWFGRKEYDAVRRSVFIDVDPGFTQMRLMRDKGLAEAVGRYDRHFTLAQRIGEPDCPIPAAGISWIKTRPPVALSHWPVARNGDARAFTTVMRWRGFHDVEHDGAQYGQKDRMFEAFIDLPRRTDQPLTLAMIGADPTLLRVHGWNVLPGEKVTQTPQSYQAFIAQSRGEILVPKHGYVATRGGWFSDRSVCYLASGRPVLMQDTGLSDWLPLGDGCLTFHDADGAADALRRVNAGYSRHRLAARRLAETHFSTDRILPEFLRDALE
jgi:hypothetical protein